MTQIALGAAVGAAVLGRRVGRKAALWGAEGFYAFRCKVGEIGNPHSIPAASEHLEGTLDDGVLNELWRRLEGG